MRVTDKEYYMEDALAKKLDYYIKRQSHNFDHLLLVGGEEGTGKTTWTVHAGYYIAQKTGANFSTDNIFFDADELMSFAARTERQIIIWDEAALGALSNQWQNKIQQKLIQCLMVARKKNHFWFFCIPYLEELKRYFIKRAAGVVYIYARKDLERGRYVFFNKKAKIDLLMQLQQKRMFLSYRKYNFRGTYPNMMSDNSFVDVAAYEKKKDDAIASVFASDNPENAWKLRYDSLKVKLGKALMILNETYNIPTRELAKRVDVSGTEVCRLIKATQEQGNRLKIMGFEPEPEPMITKERGNEDEI